MCVRVSEPSGVRSVPYTEELEPMGSTAKRVLPVANLREFFKESLHGALLKQHLAVEDQTEHYVVNLLTLFARSEALYDNTPQGMRLRPLVAVLCEALE